MIVWNHGTTGVAQGCAPSLRDASATKWSIPALEQALKAGWVVVASDFSGQGAPGAYPYLIGEGEARSSLDAVLAAGELRADLTLSPDTVVWGHSQGGQAALVAYDAATQEEAEAKIKAICARARCECTMPFGVPVVPDE